MRKGLLFLLLISATLLAAENTEFEVKKVEPFHYCAIEMMGSYMQHEQAFPRLYQSAASQGINVEGKTPFGIYFDNPMEVDEDLLEWQVGLQLEEETAVSDPLVLKKWDVKLQAETIYTGPMNEEMGTVQAELFSWIMENGYQPAGPIMMSYLDTGSEQNGQWIGKVKLIVPVSK